MPSSPDVLVLGPAYFDRVVRVDGPILDVHCDVLDRSYDGRWLGPDPRDMLVLEDDADVRIRFTLPRNWNGPHGCVELSGHLPVGQAELSHRALHAVSFHDDLGGMGAGYAKALAGRLYSALIHGKEAISEAVAAKIREYHIDHVPMDVSAKEADWTLLVTSGPHGDKLPIGFRGCHAALTADHLPHPTTLGTPESVRMLVGAGLPNELLLHFFQSWSNHLALPIHPEGIAAAPFRFFAPSRRNTTDRSVPVAALAPWIDALSCNRDEWDSLTSPDRDALRSHLHWFIITDGPRGATVFFRRSCALDLEAIHVHTFHRARPPVDTNRAGEAFAATFLKCVILHPDSAAPLTSDTVFKAARRASAAAALVLDLPKFGFASDAEIDGALAQGCVP